MNGEHEHDRTVRELLVVALADLSDVAAHDLPTALEHAGEIVDRVEQLVDERARIVAAEQVASLCGLVLRRLQEVPRPDHDPLLAALREVFGEALQQVTS